MAIHTLDWQQAPPECCRDGAVTVGNFDGVHRGHAALLAEVRRLAESVRGPAVVITFDPHPLQLLRPDLFRPVLTPPGSRAELLLDRGADEVLVLRTGPPLLQLSPAEFFYQILRRDVGLKALAEGQDFHFGRDRAGDVPLLRSLCEQAEVQLSVIAPVEFEGSVVSSSRVREALARGDVAMAARLLHRPYRLHGRVGTGQKRGRTLGFPTANLEDLANFSPSDGVYAVRVPLADRVYAAAANLGPNPTFGEAARKVEVHLIDFDGDLYGQNLAVDFIARLRDTRPFAGLDDLRRQLHRDIEQARSLAGL